MTDARTSFVMLKVPALDNWMFLARHHDGVVRDPDKDVVRTPFQKPVGTSIPKLAGILLGHVPHGRGVGHVAAV